jgi:prepilin-type N-terminal cleavage/methylation domain-containing protein
MNGRRGFSLLEAVVALVIVGLVAVSGLAAVGAELRGAARAKRVTEASELAEYRLAELRLLSRAEFEHLPDSVSAGTFHDPFAAYRWSSTAVRVAGERDLFELNVHVLWPGGKYGVATYVYRRGPELLVRSPAAPARFNTP